MPTKFAKSKGLPTKAADSEAEAAFSGADGDASTAVPSTSSSSSSGSSGGGDSPPWPLSPASSSSELPPIMSHSASSPSILSPSSIGSASLALPPLAPAQTRRSKGKGRRRSVFKADDQLQSTSEKVRDMLKDLFREECEGVIAATVRKLKQDPRCPRRGAPPQDLLLEAQQEVKMEWYGNVFSALMPRCLHACESFKSEVLKTVMNRHTSQELLKLIKGHEVDQYFMWHKALQETMSKSDKLSCPICMESFIQIEEEEGIIDMDTINELSSWKASLRTTEHWSSNPCGHVMCKHCMKTWVEMEINQQKSRIKCPAVGCSHILWDHDLQTLLSEEVFDRYKALKNIDHLQKMKDDLKDPVLRKWLRANARPCPDCHIIVSRSEGCNSMRCVCGTQFCYACGFKKCACSAREGRADIWEVAG